MRAARSPCASAPAPLLLLLLLLLAALLAATACASRSLHVGLHAPWAPTRPAAEALVWLTRAVSPRLSLRALQRMCAWRADAPPGDAPPHGRQLARVLRAVAPLLGDGRASTRTLQWLLLARAHSPRVAAHHAAARAALARFGVATPPPPVFVLEGDASRRNASLCLAVLDADARCARPLTLRADHHHHHHHHHHHDGAPLAVLQPLPAELVLSPHAAPRLRIVYADVQSRAFCDWLPALAELAHRPSHRTVLRFWAPPEHTAAAAAAAAAAAHAPSLQAFAVHATLKSTEYNVVDDRLFRTQLFEPCGYAATPCGALSPPANAVEWPQHAEKPPPFTPLQALSYISRDARGDTRAMLRQLRLFAEHAPSVTRCHRFQRHAALNATLRTQLRRAVSRLSRVVGHAPLLFINGWSFAPRSLLHASQNMFRCLSAVSTAAAGAPPLFKPHTEPPLVFHHLYATERRRDVSLRVDLRIDRVAPDALVRFNHLHSDTRYKGWAPLDVQSTQHVERFVAAVESKRENAAASNRKRHTDLVKVKAHHLSLLLVLDPGDTQQFGYLSVPQSVIQADLPIHVSMLLVPNGRTSSLVAAAFHYLLRIKGRKTAVRFLTMIIEILEYLGAFQQVALSQQLVDMAYTRVTANFDTDYASAAHILDRDQLIKPILEQSRRFAEQMNLFSDTEQGESNGVEASTMDDAQAPNRKLSMLCLLNGIVVQDIASDVVPLALSEQQRVAKLLEHQLSRQAMSEAERSFDRWVSVDPSLIVVRRVGRDLKTRERRTRVTTSDDILPPMTAGSLDAIDAMREALTEINYISSSSEIEEYTTTVWLAAMDHTLAEFLRAKQILQQLAASDVVSKLKARVAILEPTSVINHEVLGCSIAPSCLDVPVLFINGKRLPTSLFLEVDDLVIQLASHFDSEDRSNLRDNDMRLLHRLYANEVSAACEESGAQREEMVPFPTVTAAVKENSHEVLSYLDRLDDDKRRATPLSVLSVIDPLDPEAYIVASFLDELQNVYDSEILSTDVVLAPNGGTLEKEQEAPDTYRKFVLQGHPAFEEETGNLLPPRASFFGLPQESVLTVAVEPPRAWFVSSYATNYDMDNVILATLPENLTELHAEYELKNLIVEGSCLDENESPPQGLKLYLENDNGVSVDTLVMANLGYFQLKVPTPGRWNLRLAPGRSSKIFSLVRMEMFKDFTKTTYMAGADGRVVIPVESFDGAGGILLRVKRNEGMESMSLLNSDEDTVQKEPGADASILEHLQSSILSFYNSRMKSHPTPTLERTAEDVKYDTIHVFSVASGHLYERFLKIMISSVTKHASRPVKFWLLENYLSPSFKKVLPLFASRHGAEIGMVTYRWPGWLRAQTEKQRIIWAYKILFLDVLFPLDVGRIIFVDSDQVIRGDLAELMDIDLKGAPYGYVPFCDSRKEVEGYRFWKSGFWKDTLQGAKYRISALYVVDLDTFRETAAGDTLRSIYQGLSVDPNSLANLDQDLPNYASSPSSIGGSVPIFDLPEEWLWCESWCDDESKARAKAIDLCNNPMTKEPKLSSAKRIISEWVDYDNAASDLTEELYKYLQSEATPNLTPENITCEASAPKTQREKPTLPLADSQIKEDL